MTKNDKFKTFLLHSVVTSAFMNTLTFNLPGRRGKPHIKGNHIQDIKPKIKLSREQKIVKKMTNWQNHKWMQARAKNRHIAPDTFATMERRVAA